MLFVSLGVDCGTATILNSLGLRICSLPFDWVVSYEGITNIIKNDFANYLPEICDNTYEKLNKKCGVYFMHNTFPRDIEQINHRVERFKNILETCTEKIMFVRKSHGEHHHGEYNNITDDIDDAIKLDILFKEKYPHLNYEIHVILICGNCFMNQMNHEHISSNIKIHNVARPYPPNINPTNPDYFDEVCRNVFR